MGNDADPLRDECGIVFNKVWDEITETRLFGSTDIRVRPVDKFNLRVAGLREALDLLEREGFAQVLCEDRKSFAASGFQVWSLVFEWGKQEVTWYLVKKAEISCKTKLRDGENRELPSLSGEICTNTLCSAPQHYLTKYPLRKGLKEKARVGRATKDPRVYILTPLYMMKGTPPAGQGVSGAGNGGNMEKTGGDIEEKIGGIIKEKTEEDIMEKTGGDIKENRKEAGHKLKRGSTRRTEKKPKKMSDYQEQEPCQRIIIPTLDRSAQVREKNIIKLCTLPTNLTFSFIVNKDV